MKLLAAADLQKVSALDLWKFYEKDEFTNSMTFLNEAKEAFPAVRVFEEDREKSVEEKAQGLGMNLLKGAKYQAQNNLAEKGAKNVAQDFGNNVMKGDLGGAMNAFGINKGAANIGVNFW